MGFVFLQKIKREKSSELFLTQMKQQKGLVVYVRKKIENLFNQDILFQVVQMFCISQCKTDLISYKHKITIKTRIRVKRVRMFVLVYDIK